MSYSVEQIVNMALGDIGWPRPIADIYEGSPAARAALAIYSQTRDEVFDMSNWAFALREVALSLSGQTAPSPWTYEYSYPSDCIRIGYVRPGPLTGGARSMDPQPVLFDSYNDKRTTPAIRTVLCDVQDAVLVYVGKVTDPATWDSSFIMALRSALATKLAFALQRSAEVVKARAQLEGQDTAAAMSSDDDMPPVTQGTGAR